MIPIFLKVLVNIQAKNYQEAYDLEVQIVNTFVKEILQKWKDANFFLPICYRLCSDLILCAKLVCTILCRCMARSSMDCTKRLAMLNLTNNLFRLYFRISRLNLLKPLIRAIENCGPLYEHFSMADKVTFQYYIGRKAMYDSDFKAADEALTFAFNNCLPSSIKNLRLILVYLIPVKIYLGYLPPKNLLMKYNLMEFFAVAEAVKHGDVYRLEEIICSYNPFFVKSGIFLMLDKLKIMACRTLFKKTCRLLKTSQIPLKAFSIAMKLAKIEDMDADEVECVVANLIFQNKIKGYISHEHQKLVISRKNPFPSLSKPK
ncbi:unnamed protein product [Soboliphyme baturini]|uniref:PCI domain-containing protein 2 homolog n=1 Tax=Soboliphyme baturini TaxID=241478 RepID=A0A3P8BLL7_9BILA|nr:unnamed protein product [Soboliphyme baturini]